MTMPDPVNPFDVALRQLQDFGLEVSNIDTSGVRQYAHHVDDKPKDKKGWYVAYLVTTDDGQEIVVGCYGWYKEADTSHKFRVDFKKMGQATRMEVERKAAAAARQAQQLRQEVAQEAARRASEIWPKLPDSGSSPYLDRKGVAAFGLRFSRGSVVIPLRTADNRMTGLQFIDLEGNKRFLTGTAKQGAFHLLGDPGDQPALIGVAEGYATAATVYQARKRKVAVAMAFDAGNLKPVAQALRARWPGAQIIIFADDDRATAGNPGRTKAEAAAKAVGGWVWLPPLGDHPGSDWNDLQAAIGLDGVRAALDELWEARPREAPKPVSNVVQGQFQGVEWQQRLQRNDKGNLRATAFNLRLILENDPAWKGVIGWCEFSARIMKRQPPPYGHASRGEWGDADDAELRFWLGEHYGIEPKGQDLADPVLGVALAAPFHPVREYLDRLQWDGVNRLDAWLAIYLGCGADPGGAPDPAKAPQEYAQWLSTRQRVARYVSRVSAMTLIQAVARVRSPGCKADYVLILEGDQGRMKSTSLKVLFGDDFFSDTPIDIGSKDAYEGIRGLWCCEMAELDSLNKADATRAKAFFSSASDRFRLPYGKRSQKFPRQCVICGTTNQHQYLKDQTGNRRYWPVQCGDIDIESLAEMRDQIWAEADHRYRAGEPWWPQESERDLFADEQEARTDSDVWESLIAAYLHQVLHPPKPRPLGWARETAFVTMAEIMGQALRIDPGSMRKPEQTRCGIVLQALGWRFTRRTVDGRVTRGYQPGAVLLRECAERDRVEVQGGDYGPAF